MDLVKNYSAGGSGVRLMNILNCLKSKNFFFLIILIYALSVISVVFNSFPVDEQITSLLPFRSGLVCKISESDKNIFCSYGPGSTPDNFIGRIHDFGMFKTGIGFWRMPYAVVVRDSIFWPIMIHPGEGLLYYYVNKLFTFYDIYNLNLIRIHSMVIGFLTVSLIWLFLKDFLNIETANLAALLLAVNNAFLELKAIFLFSDNYSHWLALGILLLLFRYKKSSRISYLYLCSFVVGLAVYQKLTIIWFIAALLILYVLNRNKLKVNLSFRSLLNCLLFLILGSFPLIAYNLESQGSSFMALGNNFLGNARGLKEIIPAVWFNLLLFFSFLKEYKAETAILAVAAVILAIFRKEILIKQSSQHRRLIFVLLLPLIIFLLISLSTYGRVVSSFHHYEILIQFFVMAQAAIFVSFWKLPLGCRFIEVIKRLSLAFIAAMIIMRFSYFLIDFKNFYKQPGKVQNEFLDLEDVNEIIGYLEGNNISNPIFFDYNNVGTHSFISKGRIKIINYFFLLAPLNDKDRRAALRRIISINPGATFIFPVNRGIYVFKKADNPHVYIDFKALQKEDGLLLESEKMLYFDDEIYAAIRLKD